MNCILRATVISFMFLCCAQTVVAAESITVSKKISDLRTIITSAEVYLIPSNRDSLYDYSESDVVRSGCSYVVKKAADLDSLIEVLVNARITQSELGKHAYDARMVVHLHQGNVLHTLVMSPDYNNANSEGAYWLNGNESEHIVFVEAKNRIERDLRFWAAQHRSLAAKACGE